MAAPAGSVYVLADISDSGASGTAGDGTVVLQGLLEARARVGGGRADHGSRRRSRPASRPAWAAR